MHDSLSALRTQIDEHAEVEIHDRGSEVSISDHSEVDLHMDLGNDAKAIQPQHIAGSSRTAMPFACLVNGLFLGLLYSSVSGFVISPYVDMDYCPSTFPCKVSTNASRTGKGSKLYLNHSIFRFYPCRLIPRKALDQLSSGGY